MNDRGHGYTKPFGIFFELSYWNLLPAWYHITFLVLLLPANVVGAAMTRSKEVEDLPVILANS